MNGELVLNCIFISILNRSGEVGTVVACEEGDDIFAFSTLLPFRNNSVAIRALLSQLISIVQSELNPEGETVWA